MRSLLSIASLEVAVSSRYISKELADAAIDIAK
jgi:hypothetical protein